MTASILLHLISHLINIFTGFNLYDHTEPNYINIQTKLQINKYNLINQTNLLILHPHC